MRDWLELELAERLAPAEAPDALWTAIDRSRNRPPARAPRSKWPVAAIVTILVAAGALWMAAKGQSSAPNLRRLASLETPGAGPLDIHSSDPVALTAWLKRRCGIETRLAPAPSMHLLGAKLIGNQSTAVAAVSFTVDATPHTLLLAHTATPTHAGLEWAFVGESGHDLACRLCHSSL
jgi:hypothetical protein